MLQRSRRIQLAAGALTLIIPASAYALTIGGPSVAFAAAGPSAAVPSGSGGIAPGAANAARERPRFNVRSRAINALSGQTVHVRGRLLPEIGGRLVRLDQHSRRGWQTIARTRTGRRGGFDLRYRTTDTGQHRLRVRFDQGRPARVIARAGELTVYQPMVASWYDDAGGTACGFHAYYGVANKTLPCGTKVTFAYNGHTVTATVDDRGPFVAGRDWDLNQNTAGALHFGGVATVWASS
jgi:hypothetical protein